MPPSDAYNIANGSPRSAVSSSWHRLIALRIPRRRCVGRTAIHVTAAAGSSQPPGIVSSNDRSRPVPTISSPSNAASVRSSSRLVQSRSMRAGSDGRSPNAVRSVRVNAGSSSRVTGRSSKSTALVYLPPLGPDVDFVATLALGVRSATLRPAASPRAAQPRDTASNALPDGLASAIDALATARHRLAGGADAGDVRQPCEGEPDSERQEPDAQVLVYGRDGHRDQRADDPRDLEARLE